MRDMERDKQERQKSVETGQSITFLHYLHCISSAFFLLSFWICMCAHCAFMLHVTCGGISPVTFTWHTPCFIKCAVGSYWISRAHLEVICCAYMWLWNHSAFQFTITLMWLNPNKFLFEMRLNSENRMYICKVFTVQLVLLCFTDCQPFPFEIVWSRTKRLSKDTPPQHWFG